MGIILENGLTGLWIISGMNTQTEMFPQYLQRQLAINASNDGGGLVSTRKTNPLAITV